METVGLKFIDPFQWAIGIFEGEGCLTFNKNKNHWRMAVKMTDLDVLWSFYEAVGCLGNLSGLRKDPSQKEHHKPYAVWSTHKREVIHEILMRMYPFLHERRRAKFNEFFAWYYK